MSNKTPELTNSDGIITYIDEDQQQRCLGYLIHFNEHGVFDATFGKVDVPLNEIDRHNELLSQAEIAGLDQNCEVGMFGRLYYKKDPLRVTTWIGTVVSDNVVRKSKNQITFYRDGKAFVGKLSDSDDESFTFERIK